MDDQNQPPEEQPANAEGGEEIVPATQFSQEDENEDGSPPQNLEEGAPTEHQETPNNPRSSLFATPGKPPNQRDNLEDNTDMDEEDEEMVAETPHFNRNQQGKLIITRYVLP